MALLVYLLKANLAFLIGFAAYLLLLKKEPRFRTNRWVLLGIAIGSMLLPLLPEPRSPIATVQLAPASFEFTQGVVTTGTKRNAWIIYAYLAGLTIALSWFLLRLGRTLWRIRKRRIVEAFSFFGFIAVPDGSPAREAMLAHERAHARAWHSADVILLELLAAISWFDPLWRWALQELRLVHEHEADAVASAEVDHYDALLVAEALGVPSATLLNRFRTRTLKTRLLMLQRKNEPGRAWRYGIMVPVAFVALISTGWKAEMVPMDQQDKVVSNPEQQPQYPGGMEAMVQFIQANLRYPDAATPSAAKDPTIYVEFVVDAQGRVGNVNALKNATGVYADEATRVVRMMPMWSPGRDHGKEVSVRMVLPIKFQRN